MGEEKSQIRVMANGNQVVWHGDAGKMAAGTDNYFDLEAGERRTIILTNPIDTSHA